MKTDSATKLLRFPNKSIKICWETMLSQIVLLILSLASIKNWIWFCTLLKYWHFLKNSFYFIKTSVTLVSSWDFRKRFHGHRGKIHFLDLVHFQFLRITSYNFQHTAIYMELWISIIALLLKIMWCSIVQQHFVYSKRCLIVSRYSIASVSTVHIYFICDNW